MLFQKSIVFLLCLHLISADQTLQCGDWHAFKDELCFKVFQNEELQSFSDAKNSCNQYEGSVLPTIRNNEEQQFLFTLLHDVQRVVNDVWIGAQYKANTLKWINNVTVNYTNWANGYPVNESGYECVKMVLDEPSHGKWFNALCTKNNVVVCERPQNWLFSYMQTTVIEMRQSLENMAIQLESTKISLRNTEAELKNTKTSLIDTNTKLEQTETDLKTQINKYALECIPPPGTVAYFCSTSAPVGWLKANGQSVSRTLYSNLFATIGITFGSGDGSTTFTLPDLRGEFIRGWSDGRDVDKNRAFGSFQWGSNIPFGHNVENNSVYALASGYMDRWGTFSGQTFDDGFENWVYSGQTKNGLKFPEASDTYAHEVYYIQAPNRGFVTDWMMLKGTRPRNIALLACIKY